MAVTYDRNLGMYRAGDGSYHHSEAEAEAADRAGQTESTAATTLSMPTGGVTAAAPAAPPPPATPTVDPLEQLRADARRTANINVRQDRSSNTAQPGGLRGQYGATGAYEIADPATRAGYDKMHAMNQAYASPAGWFIGHVANPMAEASSRTASTLNRRYTEPMVQGTFDAVRATERGDVGGMLDAMGLPIRGNGTGAGGNGTGAAGGAGGATPGDGAGEGMGPKETAAATRTDAAGDEFHGEQEENEAENEALRQRVRDAIDRMHGGDYGTSDEARNWQREGLAQQRMLLEKMLGFDPNQYATQFADQALARQVALARSGGTPAQQQAQMFAAMDQAPSLYAEGARQASALENQRLGMAESAAKAFGELGTMTRGQDEARQQFESNLSVEIAKTIGDISLGEISLNQQESQMFAEIWTDFAELQSRYAGMDSDQQLAMLDMMFKDKELDQQWKMFKENLEAQGAISSKDLIGGFFQLGGGLVSAGGQLGAAYLGRPQPKAA